jgi:hypothetical protein
MKRNANNHANTLKKKLEQNYASYVLTSSLGELDYK